MDHAIGTDAISILTGMLRTRLRFRVVRGPPPAYGRCPSRFGAALAKPHWPRAVCAATREEEAVSPPTRRPGWRAPLVEPGREARWCRSYGLA